MTTGPLTIIHPVTDLARAKEVYGALLGVEPDMDEPYYVGYPVAGHHLGLDTNGHAKGLTGPVAFWHVDDIDATVKAMVEAGATEKEAVHEVGPGRRIATVTDPDGSVIGLLQDDVN